MSQNVTLILLCCCPLMALVGCLQWMTWHWETCLQWEPLLSPERVKQIQGSASQNSLFNVLVVLTHQSVWKGECLNYSDGQKKQLQLFITQIHLKAWFKTDEQSTEWVFWLPGDAKRGASWWGQAPSMAQCSASTQLLGCPVPFPLLSAFVEAQCRDRSVQAESSGAVAAAPSP